MSDTIARRLGSAVDREARVLTAFLALLVARERSGLLEVRARRAEGGMVQRFHAAARLREAADELLELGARTDVYVGCAPRLRAAGDGSALGAVWTLWVDCDDLASVARLAAFVPAPAVVVGSGIIRSGRLQPGCGRALRRWRHVVSEADRTPRGGGRDAR
jgi:hypothetical protein